MGYHAKLSPSSAHRWSECTASINAQEGIPNKNSAASMEGTCCHQMSAEHLMTDCDLQGYLGREMHFWEWADEDGEMHSGEDWAGVEVGEFRMRHQTGIVTVTQEMVDAVTTATDYVKQRVADTGGMLEVEQRVPIGHFTGEPDATGTADVVLMYDDTIESMDFKYGRHKVYAYDVVQPAGPNPITGEHEDEKTQLNKQLACYMLGAIEKFGGLFDFKNCKATILQPFVNHASEYACPIEELLEMQEHLRVKAQETRTNPTFKPSGENCHFCRASGRCDAQREAVLGTALVHFEDVDNARPAPINTNRLGSLYDAIPLIQTWCTAVDRVVWEELNAGRPVVRNDGLAYKLVEGQKGDRKWDDPAAVEAYLKSIRLRQEEIYTMKLRSPAQAEALAKKKRDKTAPPPVIGPTQWNRLKEHITQAPGSPAIALETDPRPAIGSSAADGFEEVADDLSDLFT